MQGLIIAVIALAILLGWGVWYDMRLTLRIDAIEAQLAQPKPSWQRLTPENNPVLSVDPVAFTEVDGVLYLSLDGKTYRLVEVE